MELNVKIFTKSSKRPAWLYRLLSAVNYWCPKTGIKQKDMDSIFNVIETEIKNTPVVRRSKKYLLPECVRYSREDNKLTIYTLYKDNPVVEFSIEQKLQPNLITN